MKGKLRTLVAMVMTAMMLTSCGANSGSGSQASGSATVSADPITMKLGLSFADSHLITQELYAMSDAVKERTNGGINIEIYADSLLGKETEMYEQLYMGTIDMALETIAFQSTTHPELTIEDLPYMFATREDGIRPWTAAMATRSTRSSPPTVRSATWALWSWATAT